MNDGEEEDGFDGCGGRWISIYSDVWVSVTWTLTLSREKANSDANIFHKYLLKCINVITRHITFYLVNLSVSGTKNYNKIIFTRYFCNLFSCLFLELNFFSLSKFSFLVGFPFSSKVNKVILVW